MRQGHYHDITILIDNSFDPDGCLVRNFLREPESEMKWVRIGIISMIYRHVLCHRILLPVDNDRLMGVPVFARFS